MHLELARDRFAAEKPIAVARDLRRLSFAVENAAGTAHATTLTVEGLPAGKYALRFGDARAAEIEAAPGLALALRIDLAATSDTNATLTRR